MRKRPTLDGSTLKAEPPSNRFECDPALASERDRLAAQLSFLESQWDTWITLTSHDLRGPLTLILGYADSLLHRRAFERESERAESDLRAVAQGARRMNKMIDQIVDGARLERGRLALHVQPTDVRAIVQEEIDRQRRLAPDHIYQLSARGDLPLVRGDPRRIGQIIASLLSNAANFSPTSEPIKVTARRRLACVDIRVADKGVGLTEGELERLFEKHYRPERSRAGRREGLGLSLWIGRQIAEHIGGRLWAESPGPDLGTTFHLELPISDES